jgi:hypothetical protein
MESQKMTRPQTPYDKEVITSRIVEEKGGYSSHTSVVADWFYGAILSFTTL